MENRPIVYGYEQARIFDYLNGIVYALEGDSRVSLDLMGGAGTTVVSGGAATVASPANMTISVAPISIYAIDPVDASAYGGLPANSKSILQIGHNSLATVLTFSTSGLAIGQSMWALVSASFSVVDSVAPNDPNNGVLPYFNIGNPSQPFQGQNNTGQIQNTLRSNVVNLSITYGGVATSGSETPPFPSANTVPLFLVDLSYGQTQIVNVLVAAPSVAPTVPNNYPQAPFLAGLLNSHHSGGAGQAPKVNLATEVQGTLPPLLLPINPPVSTNLGTAAFKNSSSTSAIPVASVSGTPLVGHLTVFSDSTGTITDGGFLGTAASKNASSAASSIVASVTAPPVVGHLAIFSDTSGTIEDGGAIQSVSYGVLIVSTSQNISPGFYFVDTSGGPITLTLTVAITGAYTFVDAMNTWGTHNLTIAGNGNVIGNVFTNTAPTFVADVSDYQFSIEAASSFWRLI